MKIAGIVCEYNPFHSGHKWMTDEIKSRGFDAVVCVMSAYFVQRGEPALFPPELRTKAALAAGADIVIRLPADAALRSAEGFAHSSVALLSALGCVDSIFFGAETPDIDLLKKCASTVTDNKFTEVLRSKLSTGLSFAAARSASLAVFMPEHAGILNSPNNILAVEYCKALQQGFNFSHGVKPPEGIALPRKGAGHDGIPKEGTASASWLRQLFNKKGANGLKGWVPDECLSLYIEGEEKGDYINYTSWEQFLVSRLKGMRGENFKKAYGAGEGIENRMEEAVRSAVNLNEVFDLAKSKRFAHSRLRRLAVSAALGYDENEGKTPPFIHVLGVGENGVRVLKEVKTKGLLPYGTSLAKLEKTGKESFECAKREAKADDIYSFCLKKPKKGGGVYRNPGIYI